MPSDIRDRESPDVHEVAGLNFIRNSAAYCFRKHHFWGMRSHIFEVLDTKDVEKETAGIERDGISVYPKAKPLNMLRLFRRKFHNLREALGEIQSVRMIEKHLGPDHYARSSEFLVDYQIGTRYELMLCGLQEYVDGERLDLWNPLDQKYLHSLPEQLLPNTVPVTEEIRNRFVWAVRENTADFVDKVKRMIQETSFIPDLAGTGNLFLTAAGNIILVDINNVSRVTFHHQIEIDDKGYPACDMSIVALSILETKILDRAVDMNETIYQAYLDPQRRKAVRTLLDDFHANNLRPPLGHRFLNGSVEFNTPLAKLRNPLRE